ncbi:carboxylesterase/lipase family protein [Actinomadura decatromicini]|uniref:Carboxylic ester hydrolase n=1 Tax=Actinomadura decatromicini TaxID=2604572 RepID=A0A5D3FYG3_9ACTN|nr:carboxylesterase family protein [Actinomadura decatromicini]TYK53213.1 carboxylesterase/lipase family protein [Actinomadura decatromicini]
MAYLLQTRQGALRGRDDHGITAYLGVPYAKPPSGERRFGPPEPAEPWDGVRDATGFGPTAPKDDYIPMYVPLFPEVDIEGDDYLNLNIWTPGGGGLPVLVWIHGGAFTNGSNSLPEYDGSAFARDGVVFVGVNYRLGAEGFAYLDGAPANRGLLDQIAALQWVQDNIAAFGGDPGRVTVAGESAGAWCVQTLLSMPRAKGLFQRAIAQSGGAQHVLTPETGRLVATDLALRLNAEPTRASLARLSPATIARAVRAVVEEVQTAPDPDKWGDLALSAQPFAPTVDGDVLPGPPLDGSDPDVALLAGTTADEARLILVASGTIDAIDEDTLHASAAAYGLDADRALAVYRANRPDARPGDLLSAIVSDWYFRVPVVRSAEARGTNTWIYRFDWAAPALGSGHGVDIPFAFDTLDAPGLEARIGPEPPQSVADAFHAVWVSFVTTGDPGWAPYEPSARTVGVITDTVTAVDDPAGSERVLWEGRR